MVVTDLFRQLPAVLTLDLRDQPAQIIGRVAMSLGAAEMRLEQGDRRRDALGALDGQLLLVLAPTGGSIHGPHLPLAAGARTVTRGNCNSRGARPA